MQVNSFTIIILYKNMLMSNCYFSQCVILKRQQQWRHNLIQCCKKYLTLKTTSVPFPIGLKLCSSSVFSIVILGCITIKHFFDCFSTKCLHFVVFNSTNIRPIITYSVFWLSVSHSITTARLTKVGFYFTNFKTLFKVLSEFEVCLS